MPVSSSNVHARGRPSESKKLPATKSSLTPSDTSSSWGRYNNGSDIFAIIGVVCIIFFCPLMVIFFWSTCVYFQCSLLLAFKELWSSPLDYFYHYFPSKPKAASLYLYASWLGFQGLLYSVLPSRISYGQTTPGGLLLPYKTNGLLAYLLSHAVYIIGSCGFGFFPPTLLYDHWGGLLIATNLYGYALSFFCFFKAHFFPSHPIDRKFSGSMIYDFFMGIELNPRFGELWDFKLFHNGRPGIVAWSLINFSFAVAQYTIHGMITDSMLLVNFLQLLYVVDFFINEDWYLRTMDIAHDHFGFYLAWGDIVWLPFMYTLQSQYLVRHPIVLGLTHTLAVLALGLLGYLIFRLANRQKDLFRQSKGSCLIWNAPARYIRAEYTLADGTLHESLLLCSGFWGLARHFNYTGDLLLSLAMCLSCGFHHLLPYFYILFVTVLLIHRIGRDHTRCHGKYGKYWDEYCLQVPYKLIPFIF